MTQQLDVTREEKQILPQHKDATETSSTPEAESVAITDTDNQQDNHSVQQDENEYRAEIKPDDKGVTIVLHSPENTPVLKTNTQTATTESSTKEDEPAQTVKRTKTDKLYKEEIIHIVVKGDTLWAIAEHYVNNPYKYSRLAKLSKIRNPDRIYPGNRVRILRHNKNDK